MRGEENPASFRFIQGLGVMLAGVGKRDVPVSGKAVRCRSPRLSSGSRSVLSVICAPVRVAASAGRKNER